MKGRGCERSGPVNLAFDRLCTRGSGRKAGGSITNGLKGYGARGSRKCPSANRPGPARRTVLFALALPFDLPEIPARVNRVVRERRIRRPQSRTLVLKPDLFLLHPDENPLVKYPGDKIMPLPVGPLVTESAAYCRVVLRIPLGHFLFRPLGFATGRQAPDERHETNNEYELQ
jgi:hypothetical protein